MPRRIPALARLPAQRCARGKHIADCRRPGAADTPRPTPQPPRAALIRGVMAVSLDLLVNAIVAGMLLGGFYAAVTVGITISFGMLDIANIAQPAFIMLGSYAAYIVNSELSGSTRS